MTAKKTFLIVCSDPSAKKPYATQFTYTHSSGKTLSHWVEVNKPVEVPEWVYNAWKNSYWNTGKEKTEQQIQAESHVIDNGNMTCDSTID